MNYLKKKKEKEIIKLEESKNILKNQELIENIINLIISKSNEDIKIEHYNKKIKQERNVSSELLNEKNSLFNFLFINKNLKEEMVVSFSLPFEKDSKEIDYKFYKKRNGDKFFENSITKINKTRMKFFNYIMEVVEEITFGENKKVKKYMEAFYQEVKSNKILFVINTLINKKESKEKEKFLKLFTKNINYKDFKEKIEKEKDFYFYYPSKIEYNGKDGIIFIRKHINKEVINKIKSKDLRKAALLLRDILTNVLVVDSKIITKEKEMENLKFMNYLEKNQFGTVFLIKKEMKNYLNKCLVNEF